MFMNIKNKMSPAFRRLEGGLFSQVAKADVGSAYSDLAREGVALMGWADPFYPDPALPPHVTEAMVESIKSGFPAHYTMPIGNMDLKVEIARKLSRYNGISADPNRNVIVTPGSDAGLFYAMLPFIEPGDEVMVPDPSYPNNFLNAELMGGTTVRVPLYEEDDYQPDVDEFRKRLTSRTKMVLLSHPNNPTTTVFRRNHLEKLAQFIVENDLILVVDQAFEDCIFDGVEFVSMATLPGLWERTVSVFSLSKGMALSGLRVGYLVADDIVMDAFYGGAVSVIGATNTAAQIGAIAAFRDSGFMAEYNAIHERRRRIAYDLFNSVPGVKMLMPESGFLSWVNVSALGDSTDICAYLIREAKVAVNDGKAYGLQGAGHLRVVHGSLKDDEQLHAALHRMREALLRFE
jgi:aspartate/methionine/tyrosine aminotransferase